VMWTTIGLVFGALAERVLQPSGVRLGGNAKSLLGQHV